MTKPWREFFPFAKPRPEQERAIDFIIDAFERQGKRFVIAELGTGLGKSAIAVTVSKYMSSLSRSRRSWYLTTQKLLQKQYVDDFQPHGMRSIKSSSNYCCQMFANQSNTMSCAGIRRLLGAHNFFKILYAPCMDSCVYREDKQQFIDAFDSVTNYPYFLAESRYAGEISGRHLLVCDEAHTIEDVLSNFVEIQISERFSRTQLGMKKFPKLGSSIDVVINWLSSAYRRALKKKMTFYQNYMKENETKEKEQLAEFIRKFELLDKHGCKLNRFLDKFSVDNWIMNHDGERVTFKPVDVGVFSEDHLFQFGERVLLMSATILDKVTFCRSLAIDEKQCEHIKIPSPFPVKNRPIHYLPVGSMSKNCIDRTLPQLTNAIETILDAHSNEKGIIHCVSFKVAKFVRDNVKSKRLLLHDSNDREHILEKHLKSDSPTVLLSPSMMEGVDLRDDRGRFQILCKLPFPFLGDEVVRKRMKLHDRWYACQTMRSIMQGLGRSIRNENDFATSYILDSDWERFARVNNDIVPAEIIDALC